jgi:hypothetical protein
MESDNLKKNKMLKIVEKHFLERFQVLKLAKENIMKAFRKKLEEKKIEEIKKSLTNLNGE